MKDLRWVTKSEADLEDIVLKIKKTLPLNAILLLEGDLASGKTTWTRLFCESYELKMVQSPTYALHQRYQNALIKIDHLDLYRIENTESLETTGLWDLLAENDNLVIIEWSERLPSDWYPIGKMIYKLSIQLLDNEQRDYQFKQIL